MFFITGVTEKLSSRCFGYKLTFMDADEAIKENRCDINETIHEYIVLEKIAPGIHSYPEGEWWYKFNYDTGRYKIIVKPEFAYGYCNWAIG